MRSAPSSLWAPGPSPPCCGTEGVRGNLGPLTAAEPSANKLGCKIWGLLPFLSFFGLLAQLSQCTSPLRKPGHKLKGMDGLSSLIPVAKVSGQEPDWFGSGPRASKPADEKTRSEPPVWSGR